MDMDMDMDMDMGHGTWTMPAEESAENAFFDAR